MRDKIKVLRREQLIEATIDTIAKHGFRKTTLGHVARKAKLSQGIVNFYFQTKETLLLETLRFLAEEYEDVWKSAVARTGSDPVAALNAMIEADFGPEVCSRKKVAVWIAFWSEARWQPQYRKLCSQLSEAYFNQARELCAKIVEKGDYGACDVDTIAHVLNSLITGLWFEMKMNPKGFERDRAAAKRACRSYLASVFPAEFSDGEEVTGPAVLRRAV
jgi:TetR/AcrR family transcriptional repressor of bet genes